MEQQKSSCIARVRCPGSVRDRVLMALLALDLTWYVVKLEGAHAMKGRSAGIKHCGCHICQGRHAPCPGPREMT